MTYEIRIIYLTN